MAGSKLSNRENEILVHASKGWTDQQIALELGISVSTVNSYWVRIRGKLGHFNRTELVAGLLRRQAQEDLSGLQDAKRDLEFKVAEIVQEASDAAAAPFFQFVVECLPEAVMVLSSDLEIIYSNSRTEDAFGFGPGYLIGRSVRDIFPLANEARQANMLSRIAAVPGESRLGIREVFYIRTAGGYDTRVVLLMQVSRHAGDTFLICILRSFLEELERLRRRSDSVIDSLG